MGVELIGRGDFFLLPLDPLFRLSLDALLGLTLGNLFFWASNNCSEATNCSSLFDSFASNFNLS